MAKQVQHRRGTTVQHNTFAGALGEITVDTTKRVVVVHDGVTYGGFPQARASDVTAANLVIQSTQANLNILRADFTNLVNGSYLDSVTATNANVAAANARIVTNTISINSLLGRVGVLESNVSFTMANYQQWTSNVSTIDAALNQLAARLKTAGY
jgi:hypothetical protein